MPRILVLSTLYFLLSVMLPHTAQAQPEQFKFRHLTSEDGLPNNFCYKIYKDSKGFIWITTRGGLARYDGYNIKSFIYDPDDSTSISNDYHKCNVTEDSAGYLWVGSQHGLNRFDPVTETFKRYYPDPEDPKSVSGNIFWCIYCDREGTVWAGGISRSGLNKYNPKTDDFTVYTLYTDDSVNRDLMYGANRIIGMYEDHEGIFWLGTSIGLYQFDRQTGELFPAKPITPLDNWIDNRFSTIAEDKDGKLFYVGDWIYTYDRANESLGLYQPLLHGIFAYRNQGFLDIMLDPYDDGNTIWITQSKYLYKYNRLTGWMDSTCYDPLNSESILGNGLKGMYMEKPGMIWVAGSHGVNIMKNDYNGIVRHAEFGEEYDDDAISFLEDSEGYWWIGTSESGLLKFDGNMELIKWYKSSMVDEYSDIFNGSLIKIIEDRFQNVWIICNTDRLYVYDRGIDRIIPCPQFEASNSFPKFIFDIYEDSRGVIWIPSRPGLYYHKPGEDFETFYRISTPRELYFKTSSSIIEDHLDNIWISMLGDGLFCQKAEDRGTEKYVNYRHDSNDSTSLSNNNVWKVYEDIAGTIWTTTTYGLNRYNREEDNFERIIFKNDIGINFCNNIIGDDSGFLLLATQSGLFRFNPNEEMADYKISHQLKQVIPFLDFEDHGIYKDKQGKFYIPGEPNSANGYFSFYPDSLVENQIIPPVVITDFLIHNEPVKLDSSINLKKHIKLKHNENYLSFEFAALDYTDPEKNQYAYMLEGLDQDWIYSDNRRFVTYTKIPPGNYTFRVKGSNNDGYWNEEGAAVMLRILPPPWATWWAYTLYGFVFMFMIYGLRVYDLKRQRLKQKLEIEHVEAEKLKELDTMKSRFFANISHEFRTPLTLILGPLEKIFSRVKDDESKQDINIAQRNARRLQRLINQLLNLSKLEAGKLKLKASERDAIPLIRGYVQSFESLARQKGIDLKFTSEKGNIPIWIDQEKFEQILFNLLSNAFKFTGEGGSVSVAVSPPLAPPEGGGLPEESISKGTRKFPPFRGDGRGVLISVTDTGKGIPKEQLEHIFDRFYQVDDTYTKDQEGTGIGLALTKELVELHHGKIEVESEVGVGTTFRVYLPLGSEHLSSEQIDKTSPVTNLAPRNEVKRGHISHIKKLAMKQELQNLEPGTWNLEPGTAGEKPIIMIVEDNADLRLYIRGYLDQTYSIIEAEDGQQGLERAIEHIPDLILSDVMMPKMDGYELCNRLKTDERTSHIPFILLTARASMESKLEGLETGADDFITKPFDPQELQVRIKNLIEQRKRWRERFLKKISSSGVNPFQPSPDQSIASMDEKFLQKAFKIVEDHLDDAEFTVEQFVQLMAMSQMQLYRKLKALVNLSANEFIRTTRLNHAAQMIVKKAGNIAEICFAVGFNNPSYFAECFKKQFGLLPSEYLSANSK